MERDQARIEALHHVGRMRPDLSPTGQIAMAAQYERYLMGELDGMSLELAVAAGPAVVSDLAVSAGPSNLDETMLQVAKGEPMPDLSNYMERTPLRNLLGVSDGPMGEDYEYAEGNVMPSGKAEVR